MIHKKIKYSIGLSLMVLLIVTAVTGCSSGSSSMTCSSRENTGEIIVTQSGFHTYFTADQTYGTELYCEFKNNTGKVLDVSTVTFELFKSDNSSMGSVSAVYAPQILQAGETGYASFTVLPSSTKPKIHNGSEPGSIVVSFKYKCPADGAADNTLAASDTKLDLQSKSLPAVQCKLHNASEKEVSDYNAVAGVFDANGTLIGCLRNDSGSASMIKANWSASTILSSWPDRTDVERFASAATATVKAYSTQYK